MTTVSSPPINPLVFGNFVSLARDSARMKGGRRKLEVTINRQYLATLWQSQGGCCAYTNQPMILPSIHKAGNEKGRRFRYAPEDNELMKASLDRIDSSKGYVPGNVHFVCRAVNYLKSTASHEQVVELLAMLCSGFSVDKVMLPPAPEPAAVLPV